MKPSGGTPTGRRVAAAGLTLIEIVIALALLGLLTAGAVAVTGSAIRAWIGTHEAMARGRTATNAGARLHEALAAIVAVAAPRAPGEGAPFLFFQGEDDAMRFVTGHSPLLGGRAGIRLVELQAMSADGGVRLVLNDRPCPDPRALGTLVRAAPGATGGSPPAAFQFAPIRETPSSRIVARDLGACRFAYLESPAIGGGEGAWVRQWRRLHELPRAIRIEWVPRTGERPAGVLDERLIVAAVQAAPGPRGGLAAWP